MKVVIDEDRCIGAGQCVLAEPRLFDQDDNNGLVVLIGQPDQDLAAGAEKAVRLCPSSALRLQQD